MAQWLTMLGAVLAVFAVMAIGAVARRVNWLTEEADQSLIHVVVRILFPALILEVVLKSTVLLRPAKSLSAPAARLRHHRGRIRRRGHRRPDDAQDRPGLSRKLPAPHLRVLRRHLQLQLHPPAAGHRSFSAPTPSPCSSSTTSASRSPSGPSASSCSAATWAESGIARSSTPPASRSPLALLLKLTAVYRLIPHFVMDALAHDGCGRHPAVAAAGRGDHRR